MSDLYAVSGEILTGIADAIRSKTGSYEQMPVDAMKSAIEGISGGFKILQDTIPPSRTVNNAYYSYTEQTAYNGWSIADFDVSDYNYVAVNMTTVAGNTAVEKRYTSAIKDGVREVYTSSIGADGPSGICVLDVRGITILGLSATTRLITSIKMRPCVGSIDI